MWIWHSFGLGDRFVCTYRFRQALFGAEQFHKAVMDLDGVTLSPGGAEYVQAIKEIKSLKPLGKKAVAVPADLASRRTAFLWKLDNLMSMETVKLTQQWDTWEHYYTYYQKLKTMGAPVTFLQETDSFDVKQYPFMVAPAYEMVDDRLVAKWKRYVEDGGRLVLTSRTGMKDNHSHLWEALLQRPIWDLIGAKVDYFDQLPPAGEAHVALDGRNYAWNVWGDILTPTTPDTEVWASYADQFYAGKPCVVKHALGKGSVYYVGVWSKDKEMEEHILRKIYTENGATILDQPDYVFTEFRDGYWVTVNYTSEAVEAPAPDDAVFVHDIDIIACLVCHNRSLGNQQCFTRFRRRKFDPSEHSREQHPIRIRKNCLKSKRSRIGVDPVVPEGDLSFCVIFSAVLGVELYANLGSLGTFFFLAAQQGEKIHFIEHKFYPHRIHAHDGSEGAAVTSDQVSFRNRRQADPAVEGSVDFGIGQILSGFGQGCFGGFHFRIGLHFSGGGIIQGPFADGVVFGQLALAFIIGIGVFPGGKAFVQTGLGGFDFRFVYFGFNFKEKFAFFHRLPLFEVSFFQKALHPGHQIDFFVSPGFSDRSDAFLDRSHGCRQDFHFRRRGNWYGFRVAAGQDDTEDG